ncbi:hypothetical protein SLS56_005167 [Neofusicoccum ribis]|uniref:Uncharacterized protein n=1 Tax=Neofusicoccum ribis TaxID=45134 RepID=A0ABR3SUE8_9PEZI
MAQLLASVKHNEADIRNLINKPIGELIEARHTYRDVRIDDIIAGESILVEAKFRKVLASRSLAIEFNQWKKSREHPTLKDFCSRIGISYDDHRHYLSRGQKILDYEKSAVSTISVVITFCWSKAMRNNDILGFAHQLKEKYGELYSFLEGKAGWLAECQSLYDGAVLQTEACDIDNGQVDVMQDTHRPADQSRQSGGSETGNIELQAQYSFPAMSAPEGIQGNSTQLVAGQPNHHYIPIQYGLVHQQARNADYPQMLDPNDPYMASNGQYTFTTTHGDLLLHRNNISWAENY